MKSPNKEYIRKNWEVSNKVYRKTRNKVKAEIKWLKTKKKKKNKLTRERVEQKTKERETKKKNVEEK